MLPILTPSPSVIHQKLLVSLKLHTWLSHTNPQVSVLVSLECQWNKSHNGTHDFCFCLLCLSALANIRYLLLSLETRKPFSTPPSPPCLFPNLQLITKPCWFYQLLNSSQIISANKSSSCSSLSQLAKSNSLLNNLPVSEVFLKATQLSFPRLFPFSSIKLVFFLISCHFNPSLAYKFFTDFPPKLSPRSYFKYLQTTTLASSLGILSHSFSMLQLHWSSFQNFTLSISPSSDYLSNASEPYSVDSSLGIPSPIALN